MILAHSTPRHNVASIFLRGLLPGLARGKLKATFLHVRGRTAWACGHVSLRHRVPEKDVVLLTVDVPRSWLRRNRWGLWYCTRRIGPERIVGCNQLRLYRALTLVGP